MADVGRDGAGDPDPLRGGAVAWPRGGAAATLAKCIEYVKGRLGAPAPAPRLVTDAEHVA